jgi:integrase
MQANEVLQHKLQMGAGASKHQHKRDGDYKKYLFSFSTYKSYKKSILYFCRYLRETHKCKTLAEARQYADEWIQKRIDEGKSAFTLKLDVAALCKLYGDSASDYIPTPKRERKNIKRSRYPVERDKHWSQEKWATYKTFCECTGLRKSELKRLTPNMVVSGREIENFADIKDHENLWYIQVNRGKGGKKRLAPIIGTPEEVQLVLDTMRNCTTSRVFPRIPDAADQHHFRSVYAERCYKRYARPVEEIPREDRCYRRKDMRKRPPLDVKSPFLCSRFLGHQRKSVAMAHYLLNI